MNYAPIGGYDHGEQCDEGLWERMCPECQREADREWIFDDRPEGD